MNIQDNETKDKLWELLNDLWDNQSDNISVKYKKNFGYWNGDYNPENEKLKDQKKTTCNIVKRIVETKCASTLDAEFTLNVVPELNSFASIQTISDMCDYADVLNSEVHNVLQANDFNSIKEILMRRGDIGGLGLIQTTFDIEEQAEGKIKLVSIEPDNFRWDKNAKRIKESTFNAYLIELNPVIVKNRYAKNPDGSYNEDLCKKIDELTETKSGSQKGEKKGVINYTTSNTAGQAYVFDTTQGIKAGKIVKLVVMFLLDDSIYTPVEGDDTETESVKKQGQQMYPNGRMIVFSPDANKKIVFDDKPLTKGFKNLGNIDEFRPLDTGEMVGKGDVDDIIPIQDRMNGAWAKLRVLVGEHISTFLFPDELKGIVKENSLVANPVTFVTSLNLLGQDKMPPYITNNNIEQALRLIELIQQLEQEAYKTAHINEVMVSGNQPKGTTSGEQLQQLNESPMSSIRAIQRNFKNCVVSVGEKIVTNIQENYTVQRLIKLSTGIDGAEYAKFNKTGDERTVELLDRAGRICKMIKVSPDWKFKVDVTSGTEIPRSRRESADLTDKVAQVMMQIQDPDFLEMYLKQIDYPNYRAVIQLVKSKQKEASQRPFTFKDLLMNPVAGKNASDILTALSKSGMSTDIGMLLKQIGLTGKVDTLETAPVQTIASKADIKDIVTTTEGKVSHRQPQDIQGREIAGAIIDLEKGSGVHHKYLVGQILHTAKGDVKVIGFDHNDDHPLVEPVQ